MLCDWSKEAMDSGGARHRARLPHAARRQWRLPRSGCPLPLSSASESLLEWSAGRQGGAGASVYMRCMAQLAYGG